MPESPAGNSADPAAAASAAPARNVRWALLGVMLAMLFTRAAQGRLPRTGPRLPAAARDAYLHGVAAASQHIFLVAAAVTAAAFLAALLIREVPLCSQPATSPTSPPQPRRPAVGHPCTRSRGP